MKVARQYAGQLAPDVGVVNDYDARKLEKETERLETRVAELLEERDQYIKMRNVTVKKHEEMRERFDEMKASIRGAIEHLPETKNPSIPYIIGNLRAILSDADPYKGA